MRIFFIKLRDSAQILTKPAASPLHAKYMYIGLSDAWIVWQEVDVDSDKS